MRRLVKIITSFFYLGYVPLVPGTIGSVGGLIVYFLVRNNEMLYAVSIIFIFTLGMLFAGKAEEMYKKKDARMIVIDEVCGMLLSLFLVPYSLPAITAGFLIFRVMDIVKPPPARSIEKLAGSAGIMIDDVVAAIYTNVILQIVFRFFIIVKI